MTLTERIKDHHRCTCGVTDRGADGYPICMECFSRKPVRKPTWLQRMTPKDLTRLVVTA